MEQTTERKAKKNSPKATDASSLVNGVEEALPLVQRGDHEMRNRTTRTQKTLRVQQVASWLLDGVSKRSVIDKSMSKWGIGERQAERYVEEANDQIEAMAATEIRGATTLALYRLTELYHAAIASEDFKTALDIIKTTNRMLGLNAPEKIEAKNVTDWNALSVAEQLDHVGGILARAGAGIERETN